VGGLGTGPLSQQNLVALLPQLNQTTTGQCVSGAQYWDIGVRGDTGPANHSSGFTLNPLTSILTDASDYPGRGDLGGNPLLAHQYCNGSRVPPENGGMGYQVPPGVADAKIPNPLFNLTPAATVDEGNNWINLAYGPLSLTNPSGAVLGNYAITTGSPAIDVATGLVAPNHDFFGTPRPQGGGFDIGATEFVAPTAAAASVTGGPLNFGNWATGLTSNALTLTLHNNGGATLTGITLTFGSPRFSRPAGASGGTCGTTLTVAQGTCTITVVFSPNAVGTVSSTLTITSSNATVTGSPVTLTGTGVANRAAVSISPNPLTITLAAGGNPRSGTGTVTLTNTAPAGGSQLTVTNVTVNAGGNILTWFFSAVAGQNTCTGTTLAPGATCTVGVRFTNVTSASGVNRTSTIVFTDNATGSPQSGTLIGHAN
jgi:hypothetical protein